MRCLEIEEFCENLDPNDYDQGDVSPQTEDYNCIAYALGIITQKWWPSKRMALEYHWPEQLTREEHNQETLENFIRAFQLFGYRLCKSEELQTNVEKVAIFTNSSGNPLHAARQLESGLWTSKCGGYEDIKHRNLACLEGNNYGAVAALLHRRRDGKPFLDDRLRAFIKRAFRSTS